MTNKGLVGFDYNWRVAMDDSRRPFTPLIQPETPTPDQSPSPRGASTAVGGRNGKKPGAAESSASPSRKPMTNAATAGKDSSSKDGKKSSAAADSKNAASSLSGKKGGDKDKAGGAGLEDSIKSNKNVKSSNKPSGKKEDGSGGEEAASLSRYNSQQQLDLATRLKEAAGLSAEDLITQRTLYAEAETAFFSSAIMPLRPESRTGGLRAESSLSLNNQPPSIMTETGYVPFSVEPTFGRIEAGKTQTFKVSNACLYIIIILMICA